MGLKDTETKEQGDSSYFDEFEGYGMGEFTPDTTSLAYLSMVQPGSAAAVNHEPGTWRNSATDENYGPSVEVVVLAFKTVWTERSNQPPYMTVGRYAVNGIPVDIEYPKPGVRGFPKMTNPTTGNKVEELFVYAVQLKNNPSSGILYFSPTVFSMKTCKQWNALISAQRIPGKPNKIAPIFMYSWNLGLELVQNPAQPANKISKFVKVTRGVISTAEDVGAVIRPQLVAANRVALLAAAPETSGEAASE